MDKETKELMAKSKFVVFTENGEGCWTPTFCENEEEMRQLIKSGGLFTYALNDVIICHIIETSINFGRR